jgi:autotransporter-associated beta strand protein
LDVQPNITLADPLAVTASNSQAGNAAFTSKVSLDGAIGGTGGITVTTNATLSGGGPQANSTITVNDLDNQGSVSVGGTVIINTQPRANAIVNLNAIGSQVTTLTKAGQSTLNLNGINTYTGGTTITGGTLLVGAAGNLGTGSVLLDASAASAILDLTNSNAIDDLETLTLTSGIGNPLVKLDFAATNFEVISALVINGQSLPAGDYNAASATYGSYFSGLGNLRVTAVPEPTGLAILGLAAMGLLRRRRPKRLAASVLD